MILLMSPAKMMRSHDAQSRHDRAFIKETRYLSGLLKKLNSPTFFHLVIIMLLILQILTALQL